MTKYPERKPYFAHRAFRLMHKASVAADIGRDAFCLIAVILHTEDAARYRGPVRFFNSQLMETLGFTRWETFNNARQKAISSGWLQYSGDGKRSAGLYFVTIPDGFDCITDDPIEPAVTDQSCTESGYKAGYDAGYKAGYDAGVKADIKAAQSRSEGVYKPVEPYIPVPDPVPVPKDTNTEAAVAAVPVSESTVSKSAPPPYTLIAECYVNAFGGKVHVTDKRRKLMRERWRDPWWRENWQQALDHGSQSAFLKGQSESGWKISFDFFLKADTAAKILEGVYDGNKNGSGRHNIYPANSAAAREQRNAQSFAILEAAIAAQSAASGGGGDGDDVNGHQAALCYEKHSGPDALRTGDVGGGIEHF